MPGYKYGERRHPLARTPVVPAWVDAEIDRAPSPRVVRRKRDLGGVTIPEGYAVCPQNRVYKAAECGTESGYQRHREQGEQTCQDCRDAVAALARVKRARRREERARADAERLARV